MTAPCLARSAPSTTSTAPPAGWKLCSTPGSDDAPYCRPGLPSASRRRRHHAQQGRLPRDEGSLRLRPAGAALQLPRHRPQRRRTRRRPRRAGRCPRRARLARARAFSKPILFAGFSFGSNVGLRACCGDPRVAGLIGLGLPVRAGGPRLHLRLPRALPAAQALRQRRPATSSRTVDVSSTSVWSRAPEPKRTRLIAGADHFFQGTAESPERKARTHADSHPRMARGYV